MHLPVSADAPESPREPARPDPVQESFSLDQLRAEAWHKVEPLYLERLAKRVESYKTAVSRQLGSDDLAQVARATMAARIGTLLVEDDRQIPGKMTSLPARSNRATFPTPRSTTYSMTWRKPCCE